MIKFLKEWSKSRTRSTTCFYPRFFIRFRVMRWHAWLVSCLRLSRCSPKMLWYKLMRPNLWRYPMERITASFSWLIGQARWVARESMWQEKHSNFSFSHCQLDPSSQSLDLVRITVSQKPKTTRKFGTTTTTLWSKSSKRLALFRQISAVQIFFSHLRAQYHLIVARDKSVYFY